MKISQISDLTDLALIVYAQLKRHGVDATLSGGGLVTIYTHNKYQSKDLDFISMNSIEKINKAMEELGFERKGRNFIHSDTVFTVEFPRGPLAVGDETVQGEERSVRGHLLKVLSPTNSIKDRLAGYYHWGDKQNLSQAISIYESVGGNLNNIKKWSEKEGFPEKYKNFLKGIKK